MADGLTQLCRACIAAREGCSDCCVDCTDPCNMRQVCREGAVPEGRTPVDTDQRDPCAACPCKDCDHDACLQNGCDGRHHGIGCMAPDNDCPPEFRPGRQQPATSRTREPAARDRQADEPPPFDYGSVPPESAAVLKQAECIVTGARKRYVCEMAIAVHMAHEAILAGSYDYNLEDMRYNPIACNSCTTVKRNTNGRFTDKENTFGLWCLSLGISKRTAYNLLSVARLLQSSTTSEREILEAASPTLLYLAANPSAPKELVQQVKAGSVTKAAEYRKLLAEKQTAERHLQQMIDANKTLGDRARRAEQALESLRQKPQEVALVTDTAEVDRLAEEKAMAMTAALRAELEAERSAAATAEPAGDLQTSMTRLTASMDGMRGIWNGILTEACQMDCEDGALLLDRFLQRLQADIVSEAEKWQAALASDR